MAFLSTSTKAPNRVRVYGLLVIASLALLALGYQLEHQGFNELVVHFTNELGIAGLVGFFLAITIEELSHAEFRKVAERERAEIKKDVFYYVYGHEIPLSIRDEIDAHVLRVAYVRRGVVMQYDLEPIQDSKTGEWYVLTTFTMSYDLENLTTDELRFPFMAAIDKSPSEELASHTRFIELSAVGCKNPFHWDEATLKTKQIDKGNELGLKLPDEIVLCPKQSASDSAQLSPSHNLTHVTMKTETVRFLRGGHIDFIFTSHVCDLELTVWGDRRLKVDANTFEQNPLERVTELPSSISWLKKRVQGEFYFWRLKRPLLAYQSLQITWTPQDAEFNKAPENPKGQL